MVVRRVDNTSEGKEPVLLVAIDGYRQRVSTKQKSAMLPLRIGYRHMANDERTIQVYIDIPPI